jgi:hypothetical protein
MKSFIIDPPKKKGGKKAKRNQTSIGTSIKKETREQKKVNTQFKAKMAGIHDTNDSIYVNPRISPMLISQTKNKKEKQSYLEGRKEAIELAKKKAVEDGANVKAKGGTILRRQNRNLVKNRKQSL